MARSSERIDELQELRGRDGAVRSARLLLLPLLDACDECDVVWLDFGELRQIEDAPGRDRGSRNMPLTRPGTFLNALGPDDARELAASSDPLTMLFRLLS